MKKCQIGDVDPNLKYLLEHKYTRIFIILFAIFIITSLVVMLYLIFHVNEISNVNNLIPLKY